MNSVYRLILISIVSAILLSSCGDKKEDPVVLEVGAKKVGISEYETFFAKNTGGLDSARKSSQQDREKFLDLLTNYKLKLQDAYDRGYESDPEIQMELKEYRSSLASSFLVDKEVTTPGVEQVYARRKEELRAQQILIAMKPNSPAEDTLKAYNKALDIIKQAKSGMSFDTLVLQYSEDPSARSIMGDVYYFTSGQLSGAFESAAYSLKKGEVYSLPVRSQAGFHIIKLIDRKPSQYMIKVRHIMARFNVSATDSADTTNALIRVHGFQDSLKKGWKFAELATKLSEDAGSAPEGGDLGWFERRRWVQPFDEAAFNLKVGTTSEVIKSPFGFHLLYCDSARNLPPFAEVKEDFKKRYQQTRFNEEYDTYVKNLKVKYNVKFNDDVYNEFIAGLDSTFTVDDSGWSAPVPSTVLAKTMFSVNGKGTIVDSVIALFNRRIEYRGTSLRDNDLRQKIDRIIEGLVLDEHSIGLENKYADFASLMKEYKDGIILFKAEQQEVWNKVTVTDSALKVFYTKNKERFRFPNRIAYSEIEVDSDTLALMIYDSVTHGGDFSDFAERYNTDPEIKARKGANELAPIDQDDFTRFADSMQVGDVSQPQEMTTGGFIIMKVTKKESERIKTYEEAGAELSNAFQESESKRLEKAWIDKVKDTYPVKQYKEQLQNAFLPDKK